MDEVDPEVSDYEPSLPDPHHPAPLTMSSPALPDGVQQAFDRSMQEAVRSRAEASPAAAPPEAEPPDAQSEPPLLEPQLEERQPHERHPELPVNWMMMILRSLWVNLLTSKLQWPGRINKTHVPIQQIFLYLKMMI